jgi:hypothetical protein
MIQRWQTTLIDTFYNKMYFTEMKNKCDSRREYTTCSSLLKYSNLETKDFNLQSQNICGFVWCET